MRVKVTLEIEPVGMGDMDAEKLQAVVKSILCDALGEFQSARSPARAYVMSRYADRFEKDSEDRERKVSEVEDRLYLARLMHHPATEWESYRIGDGERNAEPDDSTKRE